MEPRHLVNYPSVILLDAAGTLFGVRGSVGEIYSTIAREWGVIVESAALNQGFKQSFQASSAAVFPGVSAAELPVCEFEWWLTIARHTFSHAGVLEQFTDFPAFFADLYAHFAMATPWVIYPEVPTVLEQWRSQGIELGIVSNFDSRLYSVLKALNLTGFFTSITISTEVGAAKPDVAIFNAALQKYSCSPAQAWHIGDSYHEDYVGARAAGLKAFWLQRGDNSIPVRLDPSVAVEPIATLKSLQE